MKECVQPIENTASRGGYATHVINLFADGLDLLLKSLDLLEDLKRKIGYRSKFNTHRCSHSADQQFGINSSLKSRKKYYVELKIGVDERLTMFKKTYASH